MIFFFIKITLIVYFWFEILPMFNSKYLKLTFRSAFLPSICYFSLSFQWIRLKFSPQTQKIALSSKIEPENDFFAFFSVFSGFNSYRGIAFSQGLLCGFVEDQGQCFAKISLYFVVQHVFLPLCTKNQLFRPKTQGGVVF